MRAFARRQGVAPAAVVHPAEHPAPDDLALIDAYRYLQITVGIIAVLLPIVTVGGAWIADGEDLHGTISAYYYSRMGAYFVGSMCVLGVIFRSYRRKPRPEYKIDNTWTNIAGLLAVVVALIPTSSDAHPNGWSWTARTVHVSSAAALLLILAYLSYCRFTLPPETAQTPPEQRGQNRIYRWCGGIMLIALGAFVLATVLHAEPWITLSFESIAVIAFGVSWIVKSERFRPIVKLRAARA
jgi:hypothetical protein